MECCRVGENSFHAIYQGGFKHQENLRTKTVGSKCFTGFGLLEIPPGGVFPQHTHPDREMVYYALSGLGTIKIEDKEVSAKKDLTIYVSRESSHGVINQSDRTLMIMFVHARV